MQQVASVSVADFVKHIKEQAFPNALKELESVKSPEEVRVWREHHHKELRKVMVKGEALKDAIKADDEPQEYEEIKEALSFSKRIYLEAVRVQDACKTKEVEFKQQIS